MRTLRALVLIALTYSTLLSAQGNSWSKVRYNGGTVETKVHPNDWDNHLTITPDLISLQLKDGQGIEIPTKSVTGLSYGQEAHRREGTMIALGVLVAPEALFGLLHKTRLHYIGVEYTASGNRHALLLQGDKSNYRAILLALQSVTNATLSITEKDREYVPTTVRATVVTDSERMAERRGGSLSVSSDPNAADVFVDGEFAGNTPCKLNVSSGAHVIKVAAKGYKDWSRQITVGEGSEATVNAGLEK